MSKGLTRAAIVTATLELLDEVGLEGLTVRALAAKLDVKAPALYWHVRDKAELFDEVATEVWRGIGEELADIAEGTEWDVELRRFCDVLRSALLRHRDGAKAFSGTYLTDPGILGAQESGLQRWLAQGFSVRDTARAFALANGFVVGFCIEEQAVGQADDRQHYDLQARAERVGAAEHPLTVEAGVELFGDRDAQFEALVDLVVVAVGSLRGAVPKA
ncbi:TetR family transcriptional regulator [Planctomonas sp. JC2975]|uniref:TetR/AcrR family transcriptional regulator C-terminal domain-containing protein n=1 Tax=Planctomonas sp. JC2975 TaxID=2729626 RepID=UPI0014759B24|nr:TetR/AcrR family transcriptional regulator C-terminal domain-containing protein [Planctomonas sp. JC2975]NNC11944.1 TetR family transcriptional regulator [Planctomonas sp. JC2975]